MAERRNPTAKKENAARAALRSGSTGEKAAAKPEEKRATFIVDANKLKKLKIYAATQEKKIKEVIDEALSEYMENHKIK